MKEKQKKPTMSKIQATKMLDNVIGSPPSKEKKELVYCLKQIARIGQVSYELHYIKTLYQDLFDEIIIFTPNIPSANEEVLKAFLKDCTVVRCNNMRIYDIGWSNAGLIKKGNRYYALIEPGSFHDYIIEHIKNGGKLKKLDITQDQKERGRLLKEKMNIPKNAKTVCLHVREAGYLPNLSYHSFRDADIDNYKDAIKYLIDKGYYVIRLGDKSMKPFPVNHKQVIDLPFNEHYEPLADVYFISDCAFYIGCFSGPISVATALGKDIISVNSQIQYFDQFSRGKTLYIYKHYFSKSLNRNLNYLELLNSDILGFSLSQQFEDAGIEILENTSQEILLVIKEMVARTNNEYKTDDSIYEKIKKIEITANKLNKKSNKRPIHRRPESCSISQEFIKSNPSFIKNLLNDKIEDEGKPRKISRSKRRRRKKTSK